MKKITLLLLAFVLIKADAQQVGKLAGSNGVPKYYEFYDNSGNRIPTAEMADVNGSPFLKEQWGKGVVKFRNGKEFTDTMNYSLYENKLYYKKENKVFPISNAVDEFLLTYKNETGEEEVYFFKSGYPVADKNDINSFYEVVYKGAGLHLLKWEHKKISETADYGNVRTKEFAGVEQCYVYAAADNTMTYLPKTTAAVKKALPQYAAAIDMYVSQHKMNWKDAKQLGALITFLDKKQ